MPPTQVLLVGRTSAVGSLTLECLRRQGHEVRCLVRRPSDPHDVQGDLTIPRTLDPACEGIDVIVHMAGAPVQPVWGGRRVTFDAIDHRGTEALARSAAQAGVRRMVYLSVAGDYPTRIEYVEAHRRGEAAIADAGLEPGIVRATGFHGTLCFLVSLARRGPLPLPGAGTARTNPIAEADLAEVLAEMATSAERRVDVGGPEVLTRREILQTAFEAAGRTPRILRVPTPLLRAGGGLMRPFNPRLADLSDFFAWIHDHDEVAPHRGQRTLLDSFRAFALSQS